MLQVGQWAASGRRSRRADPGLGHPAARAEQVPAQLQQPRFHRLQAGLDHRQRLDSSSPGRAPAAGYARDRPPAPFSTRSARRRARPWPLGRGLDRRRPADRRAPSVSGDDFGCGVFEGRFARAGGELGRLLHRACRSCARWPGKSRSPGSGAPASWPAPPRPHSRCGSPCPPAPASSRAHSRPAGPG